MNNEFKRPLSTGVIDLGAGWRVVIPKNSYVVGQHERINHSMNNEFKRPLVSLRVITNIIDIGADKIELAQIKGWRVIIPKSSYAVGQKVVYFELDSSLPIERKEFSFLKPTHGNYHVLHSRRFTINGKKWYSQGFVLPVPEEFMNRENVDSSELESYFGVFKHETEESFGSKQNPNIIGDYPIFLKSTSIDRVQNIELSEYLDKTVYATMKIDGTSLTAFNVKRPDNYDLGRNDPSGYMGLCTRALELALHTDNLFYRVLNELNVFEKLRQIPFSVALQGEFISPNMDQNPEKSSTDRILFFKVFNIDSQEYLTPTDAFKLFNDLNLETVPILFKGRLRELGADINSLLLAAEGEGLRKGSKREGLVIQLDDGTESFKVIANSYI